MAKRRYVGVYNITMTSHVLRASTANNGRAYVIITFDHSHLILSLITRWLAILAFSSYRGIVGHITTMMDYAQIHIFDACGHYKGRLLLILILHNVMHDITSTLPVDVAPSARFTQNGRPMSIAGGRHKWFGYYWLWFDLTWTQSVRPGHAIVGSVM